MIFNQSIERLLEIKIVQELIKKYEMSFKTLNHGEEFYLLIYRRPYIIEISERLIENILDIFLYDLDSDLNLMDGRLVFIAESLQLPIYEICNLFNFKDHTQNNIFLTFNEEKMFDLHLTLTSIDLLLPVFINKGGFMSLKNGEFSSTFSTKELPSVVSREKISNLNKAINL